jgi:alpha-L-fucosidase
MKLKQITLTLLALAAGVLLVPRDVPAAPDAVRDDPLTAPRTRWFREAKYGMFIHWGLYAVPAGYYMGKPVPGIGEWIMHTAKIPIPEYEKYAPQFNPVKFDAKEWARVAKSAGMKYMVITSKHHDGFSMFRTRVNPYNIVDATPFKRDPIKELSQACKAEGIKFGLYHSIMDWHHADANPAGADRYIPQMKEQLREIVANYDPALLWFDGEWVEWWDQAKGRDLEKFLRELKPELVINNRIGKRKMDDGDYETPEQEIPRAALGRRLWETCMTLNDTWGFKRDDHNWKTPEDVLRKLADIAGKGGNFLLNVGPTAEGEIPEPSIRILEEAGKWLKDNGEAIYGTVHTPMAPPSWGSITRKGNRLYLIVFNWPKEGGPLRVPLRSSIRKAALLKGGSQVRFRSLGEDGGVELMLPARPTEKHASVVTVDFQGELLAVKSLAERTAAGEPIPVNFDGSILLPAEGARLHGRTIQYELKDADGNIGYWTNPQEYVEWFVQPKAAGRFNVELVYACAPGHGGEFVLALGDEKRAGKIESTGGWDAYKTMNVGAVQLPARKVSVTVKPGGNFQQALMNLKSVRLTPAQ